MSKPKYNFETALTFLNLKWHRQNVVMRVRPPKKNNNNNGGDVEGDLEEKQASAPKRT